MLVNFDISEEEINGTNILVLKPERVLTDSEYDTIKLQMEEIGAHWRERVHGFTLPLTNIKRQGYTEWQEKIQYFPTPVELAKRVVELSGLNELSYDYDKRPKILEPSAGTGRLLEQVPRRLCSSFYIVEPEETLADYLNDAGYFVERETFEEFYRKNKNKNLDITHVIMNPPFSKQRDIKHTMMAFDLMAHGGILVSVISENSLYYDTEETKKFREWAKANNATFESVETSMFKESGTTIDTVIVKVVKE